MTEGHDEQPVERITHAQAASLLSCHPSNIAKLVKKGHLISTGIRGPDPSLNLDEVVQLREQRLQAEAERQLRFDRTDPRPQGPPAGLGNYPWISVPEVARRLGVTPQSVRARAQRGTIPHVRHEKRIWIRADHLETWQRARQVDGPDDVVALEVEGERRSSLLSHADSTAQTASPASTVPP